VSVALRVVVRAVMRVLSASAVGSAVAFWVTGLLKVAAATSSGPGGRVAQCGAQSGSARSWGRWRPAAARFNPVTVGEPGREVGGAGGGPMSAHWPSWRSWRASGAALAVRERLKATPSLLPRTTRAQDGPTCPSASRAELQQLFSPL